MALEDGTKAVTTVYAKALAGKLAPTLMSALRENDV